MIFLNDENLSDLFGAGMAEQLVEAGMLLAVGMSVVFAFLTLLIGGIQCIAWVGRKFPEPAVNDAPRFNKPVQASTTNKVAPTVVPEPIAKAIAAAIHTHRRENN